MHVIFVLAALVFGPFALGQTGNASDAAVRGTVTTGWPDYRPLSNVTVLAESPVDVRTTRTDEHGRYFFLTLIPGVYRIDSVIPQDRFVSYAVKPLSIPRCMEKSDFLVELSAGVEYEADIELTHCR